ncbi:hypothetical protein [Methylophaga nitratireducenticrescens]|uniref:hypothetical protein n=1 Tax=Methylophaga nitratireducenticrescens TaxID=754476 RepID=UPI000CDBAC41|nr:hypothetical protein [Methylophaga nitratireducenticrescens]AUZ84763.1 hypothetical protein CDW43_09330 [Methylophaga nitratireducenticrescens]
MPRPKSVESAMRAAFERLLSGKATNLPEGTAVTLSNVAKEADMNPMSLRKERYPELHREICAYAEINANSAEKPKRRKTRESDTKRIKRLKLENEKLTNIVLTLSAKIEELEHQVESLKDHITAN